MHDTARDGEDALSEKSLREQSIRRNRRQKFVDCITSEDVSMGAPVFTQIHSTALTRIIAQLRKLAWNGVPEDLRPIAWPLLLVSSRNLSVSLRVLRPFRVTCRYRRR